MLVYEVLESKCKIFLNVTPQEAVHHKRHHIQNFS